MNLCKGNILSGLNKRLPNENYNNYINRSKNIFRTSVFNQNFIYKNKPIHILFAEDFDACFKKFMIGGDNYHNGTNRIDATRIERINWIYDILSNHELCKEKKCSNLIEKQRKDKNKDNKTRNNIYIYCKAANYVIVMAPIDDGYLLKTSYYVISNNLFNYLNQ